MTYTDEKHAQILLSLLKAHGVSKVVASPGATNIPIVGSIQNDPFFTVFSSVDERSAAYLACGLAEETGEIVVLSCTGATASRNYMPGLTEAYYRKLPVIAITSFNGNHYLGNLVPQNIDRTVIPKDVAKISVHLPIVKDEQDEWQCNLLTNKAILEATRNGGGPVHINLTTTYLGTFTTKELPNQRVIRRYTITDELPSLTSTKIAIFIGAHKRFSQSEVKSIENFCERYQAIVVCDHTSSYFGKYRVLGALASVNFTKSPSGWQEIKPELVIHLGEVSGDYASTRMLETASEVWRVSEDGEIRDRAKKLTVVYQGTEESFFSKACDGTRQSTNNYYEKWLAIDAQLRGNIPELPFSNPWIAQSLAPVIPAKSSVYFGILNSLRSWNYFLLPNEVYSSSNVGGFGIDGCLSTAIGASLANPSKLIFSILGDLAFFYDVNVIANRHVGNNIRILLINNGCGVEFNLSSHVAAKFEGEHNTFIAAAGHFASGENNQFEISSSVKRAQKSLARSWAEVLGFTYLKAESKEEFVAEKGKFLDSSVSKPIIFECFTDERNESESHELVGSSLNLSTTEHMREKAKDVLPDGVKKFAKKLFK